MDISQNGEATVEKREKTICHRIRTERIFCTRTKIEKNILLTNPTENSNQLTISAHIIEGVNRTQHMQFHPFTFTGKERDAETGYSYFGARYYDSDLSGLFLSVDPMSDKYPNLSPYAYCAWNPVIVVDPDGRELTDFYDIATGEHLKHVADGKDEAIAINKSVFDALEKENVSTAVEKKQGVSLGSNSVFVAIAGTLYAESTPGNCSFEEMAAIGSVMRNRAKANNCSVYEIASNSQSGIYGYKDRGKINNPRANRTKVNMAFKAAMYTLCTNIDYSNGGYYWQGKDFSNIGSKSYNEYYNKGFLFVSSKVTPALR